MRNPPSTKQTLPFYDILATDINGHNIAVYQSVGPAIKNQLPSLAVGTLTQLDNTLSATTTYTFTYTTANYMPRDSSLLLEYPHTVTLPPELDTCHITYLTIVYNMRCLVDVGERSVKIYEGLASVSLPEGSEVILTISPVKNPGTP